MQPVLHLEKGVSFEMANVIEWDFGGKTMFEKLWPIPVKELTGIRDLEANEEEYLEWKRHKITTALSQAEEHPDRFLTKQEIWEKHGIAD